MMDVTFDFTKVLLEPLCAESIARRFQSMKQYVYWPKANRAASIPYRSPTTISKTANALVEEP